MAWHKLHWYSCEMRGMEWKTGMEAMLGGRWMLYHIR